jgi:prophage regulatory protein
MPTNIQRDPNEQPKTSNVSSQIQIDSLVRLKEFLRLTGLGRSTVYKMISQGLIERPLRISQRTVGWRSSSVQAFIDSRQNGGGQR